MTTTHKEWQAALRWEMQQRGLAPPTRRAYSRWVGRFLRYLGAAGPRNAGLSQVKGYLAWSQRSVLNQPLLELRSLLYYYRRLFLVNNQHSVLAYDRPRL